MILRNIFLVFLILNVKGLQPQNDFPSQEFIDYATRFWKVIVKNVSKETNVFYCPMGLLRVLFMLELGADGESATQIRDATFSKNWRPHLNHYDKQNLTGPMLSVGDGGFFDGGLRKYLREIYESDLRSTYKFDVREIPPYDNANLTSFYLNQKLQKIVRRKIRFFTSSMFGRKGNAMLFTGFNFKGSWNEPFKKMNTRKGEFHVNPKKKVRLPMMSINLSLKLVKNYEEMGFNVVEIPLQKSRIVLVIIEPTGFSIEKIVDKLNGEKMARLLNTQGDETKVNLTLPKFRFRGKKHDITDYLMDNQIGIKAIFNRNDADFSNMMDGTDVVVKKIIEQSYFSINERNFEIAGVINSQLIRNDRKIVTVEQGEGGQPGGGSKPNESPFIPEMPRSKTAVNINQPFMFMLKDTESGTPLLFGKISNPKLVVLPN